MITIDRLNRILFVLNGLFLLLLRPGIPGQLFGGIYIFASLCLVVLPFVLDFKLKNVLPFYFVVWHFVFSSYIFFTSLILQSTSLGEAISILLINTIPIIWFFRMDERSLYVFFRVLIKLIFIMSISAIITYFMLIIAGQSIKLYEIKLETFMKNDHYSFGLFFPFTFLYSGAAILGDMWLPRYIGLFREPGIMQFISLFAYYTSYLYYKGRKLLFFKVILFTGFFLSFSTAGLIGFFSCEVVRILFFARLGKKYKTLKKFVLVTFGIACAFLFFLILMDPEQQFSIAGKMANKSGSSRVMSIYTAFNYFWQKPLTGFGFHHFSRSVDFENVNLLTALSEIGIIGFSVYLIPYVILLWKFFKNRMVYFFILFNFFIMILVSQPIYYLPLSGWVLAIGAFLSVKQEYFNKILILRQ